MQFDLAAYLGRIGLEGAGADPAGLHALQAAHMRAVPFENFDPLLGRIPDLTPEGIFGKLVGGRRGGYCFEQNSLFDAALRAAGFSTRRALARVRMRFGAEGARTHLVLLVEIGGELWLADVGFGGPGSLAPLRIEIGSEQQAPNGTYRFTEDAERGEMVLERREGGGWLDLYAFDRARVSDGEIHAANFFCAVAGDAPFGSHLLLGFYVGNTRYGLFDRALTIENPDGEERRELSDFAEFAALIEGTAGIALPPESLSAAWDRIGHG